MRRLVTVVVFLAACSGDPGTGPVDVGVPDANGVDAASLDAAPVDADDLDAAPLDAETADATPADAAAADAAPCVPGCRPSGAGLRWTSFREGPVLSGYQRQPSPQLDPTDGRWMSVTVDHIFRFDPTDGRWTTQPTDRSSLDPFVSLNPSAAVFLPSSRRFLVTSYSRFWTLDVGTATDTPARWDELELAGTPDLLTQSDVFFDATSSVVLALAQVAGSVTVWRLHDADRVGATPTWAPVATTANVPSRATLVFASYDSAADRLYVVDADAVWTLAGAARATGTIAWSRRSIAGTAPSARVDVGTVLDASGDRVFMHGGRSDPGLRPVGELWALEALSGAPRWRLLSTSTFDTGPVGIAAVRWDAPRARLIVQGGGDPAVGQSTATWAFEPAAARWSRVAAIPGHAPNATAPWNRTLAYHEATDRLLVLEPRGVFSLAGASGCGAREWIAGPLDVGAEPGAALIGYGVFDRAGDRWWIVGSASVVMSVDVPPMCGLELVARPLETSGGWSSVLSRSGVGQAIDTAGQTIFMYGGYSRNEGAEFHLRELWALDVRSSTVTPRPWRLVASDGPLGGRLLAVFHVGGDRMIVQTVDGRIHAVDGVATGPLSARVIGDRPGALLAHRAADDTLIAVEGERVSVMQGVRTATVGRWQEQRAAGDAPSGPGSMVCSESTGQCFVWGGPSSRDLFILDGL